jgi:hypothetical protein
MKLEAFAGARLTDVRHGHLIGHAARRLDADVFAVLAGEGAPRARQLAIEAALAGLEAGLVRFENAETPLARALQICEAARNALFAKCESLIERELPDAALGYAAFADGSVSVISAGPIRAYLHRRGKPQRLTPREDGHSGLLRAPLNHCTTSVEPGDLLMLGSISAFSVKAVSQIVSALSADSVTPVATLADILLEPAAQAGEGAAAVVVRVC